MEHQLSGAFTIGVDLDRLAALLADRMAARLIDALASWDLTEQAEQAAEVRRRAAEAQQQGGSMFYDRGEEAVDEDAERHAYGYPLGKAAARQQAEPLPARNPGAALLPDPPIAAGIAAVPDQRPAPGYEPTDQEYINWREANDHQDGGE